MRATKIRSSKLNLPPLSLVDLLRKRASQQPNQPAYRFVYDGEVKEICWSYADLDQRARAIGARLQSQGSAKQRALLLYPPGLDYIAAFMGCLYAGVVAVPVYPPRLNRPDLRLKAVAADAQATLALTTSAIATSLTDLTRRLAYAEELSNLQWLATDEVTEGWAADWRAPVVDGSTPAFLQYTSGSTTTPRGVLLTHGNLLHNLALIQTCFEAGPHTRGVIWLPPYHDMGLIGGILEPLYGGFPVTLMTPLDFLQRPLRWLHAISQTQATISGGPNFAYDLCVRKITLEQRATLDLSSWEVAFTGAEPIRSDTLERFVQAFGPCGFRREAFYPCYGLAEATLIVSGGRKADPPVVRYFIKESYAQGHIREAPVPSEATQTLIGCGQCTPGQKIVIADPEKLTLCAPDQIGEVWVAGPSVAQGYWNRPEETAYVFHAQLADTGAGPFLRTGDLGFVHQAELFLASRLKDLIIIRGHNYYPQDIELTVEQSHPILRPGSGVAFGVEDAEEERLVVVQELNRGHQNLDLEQVVQAIRQAVSEQYSLQTHEVVLVRLNSIPKTSSGKIQRQACRAQYFEGRLEIVHQSSLNPAKSEVTSSQSPERHFLHKVLAVAHTTETRRALIGLFLEEQVGQVLHMTALNIDVRRPLSTYGLGDAESHTLKQVIEMHLGVGLPTTEHLQQASLAQLLAAIEEQLAVSAQKL